jgi:hypothetical protein
MMRANVPENRAGNQDPFWSSQRVEAEMTRQREEVLQAESAAL